MGAANQFRDDVRAKLRAMFLGAIAPIVPVEDRELTADAETTAIGVSNATSPAPSRQRQAQPAENIAHLNRSR